MKSLFPEFLGVPPDLEAELLDKTRRHWHTLDEMQRDFVARLLAGAGSIIVPHHVGWDFGSPLRAAWGQLLALPWEVDEQRPDMDRLKWHERAQDLISRLP